MSFHISMKYLHNGEIKNSICIYIFISHNITSCTNSSYWSIYGNSISSNSSSKSKSMDIKVSSTHSDTCVDIEINVSPHRANIRLKSCCRGICPGSKPMFSINCFSLSGQQLCMNLDRSLTSMFLDNRVHFSFVQFSFTSYLRHMSRCKCLSIMIECDRVGHLLISDPSSVGLMAQEVIVVGQPSLIKLGLVFRGILSPYLT